MLITGREREGVPPSIEKTRLRIRIKSYLGPACLFGVVCRNTILGTPSHTTIPADCDATPISSE
jgi:hypothetical protein